MTREGQYFAVIGILVACLSVTALGAVGVQAVRPLPAAGQEDVAVLAPLETVEAALAQLTEATARYAADADAASREALERALVGFGEVRIRVEGMPPGAKKREEGQLLDAVQALVPRIHLLALEMADEPTRENIARLGRLAAKTRAALDQLREGAARRPAAGPERIGSVAPGAAESFVPEGVVVLFLTIACAVAMALFASTLASHPLRRTHARASRHRHGLP